MVRSTHHPVASIDLKERFVSLHTLVQGNPAGRLLRRRLLVPPVALRALALPNRVSISSMRVLETGIALGAIATALLIGHGH